MATAEQHGEEFHHGHMDISSQKALFGGFIKTVEYSCVATAMLLGLLVFAFAMGLGWWAGLAVWVVIGVLAGFLMGLGAGWWAVLIGSTLVLAIGGGIVAGVQALL